MLSVRKTRLARRHHHPNPNPHGRCDANLEPSLHRIDPVGSS